MEYVHGCEFYRHNFQLKLNLILDWNCLIENNNISLLLNDFNLSSLGALGIKFTLFSAKAFNSLYFFCEAIAFSATARSEIGRKAPVLVRLCRPQ